MKYFLFDHVKMCWYMKFMFVNEELKTLQIETWDFMFQVEYLSKHLSDDFKNSNWPSVGQLGLSFGWFEMFRFVLVIFFLLWQT